MTFTSRRWEPNKNWVLCARLPKCTICTGVQNTSVDKNALALTMGRTPRQHQLTGCRRCLPLHQATSCNPSMHLTLAMMGARTHILMTQATRDKMKMAAALERKSCSHPSQLHCHLRSTPGNTLPTMHLFMMKLISTHLTSFRRFFTVLRRCTCVWWLRWTMMRRVTTSTIGPPST